MKASKKMLLGIGVCIIFLSSCQKNKQELQGSIVFKVQAKSNIKKSSAGSEPVAAAILVTIENDGGKVLYNQEKLELISLNGSYLSKGLPLPAGNYNLTEFLVADANNHVIYATPKKGSILSTLVNNPLPMGFVSYPNAESILIPEVIKTDTSSLEDLGYAGFSFNPVSIVKFLMTVFSKEESQLNFETLDSCDLLVTSPSGRVFNYVLKNGVNPVYVNSDTGKYILTISKKGYKPCIDTLNNNQLQNYSITPLHVILAPLGPCISFLSKHTFISYIGPSITARSVADFYVDWGDGTYEDIITNSYSFYKDMDLDGERLLQIRNNLGEIKSVSFPGWKNVQTNFTSVDLSNAKAIDDISVYYTNIGELSLEKPSVKKFTSWFSSVPLTYGECENLESINFRDWSKATIDIQTNDKLKSLSTVTSDVLFGANPNLTSILLYDDMYSPSLTEDDLNTFLTGLLTSVQSSPRAGQFVISSDDTHNAVYPSGDGLEAAKTLKNTYNWTLSVNSSVGLKGKVSSLIRE